MQHEQHQKNICNLVHQKRLNTKELLLKNLSLSLTLPLETTLLKTYSSKVRAHNLTISAFLENMSFTIPSLQRKNVYHPRKTSSPKRIRMTYLLSYFLSRGHLSLFHLSGVPLQAGAIETLYTLFQPMKSQYLISINHRPVKNG